MFSCRTYKDEFQLFQLRGKEISAECYYALIQGGHGLLFFIITKSSSNSKEKHISKASYLFLKGKAVYLLFLLHKLNKS